MVKYKERYICYYKTTKQQIKEREQISEVPSVFLIDK